MSFFAELKRRNVFRVGIAYVVAAWLVLQLTEVLSGLLELQADLGKIVIVLLIIGFPVALFFWIIASLLMVMTLLAIRFPETPRVGILRIETTRGDRLFISLLGSAFINLGWLFFLGPPLWGETEELLNSLNALQLSADRSI